MGPAAPGRRRRLVRASGTLTRRGVRTAVASRRPGEAVVPSYGLARSLPGKCEAGVAPALRIVSRGGRGLPGLARTLNLCSITLPSPPGIVEARHTSRTLRTGACRMPESPRLVRQRYRASRASASALRAPVRTEELRAIMNEFDPPPARTDGAPDPAAAANRVPGAGQSRSSSASDWQPRPSSSRSTGSTSPAPPRPVAVRLRPRPRRSASSRRAARRPLQLPLPSLHASTPGS